MEVFSEVTEALQPHLLHDIEVVEEDGAAAQTELEVDYKGLRCTALRLASGESETDINRSGLLQRMVDVCEILGRLRHPHVVQFLGISLDTTSPRSYPMIVNELSPLSLATSINRYGVLPNELSYNIVRDVALGLRYLHELQPSFVHGDLSAKSVLLTGDFTAKISRLGVAHLVKQGSGTVPYHLPPEVTEHSKRFDRKVDVFSFGIIMLHTFTGRPPVPKVTSPSPERGEIEDDCKSVKLKVPSQTDMRVEYINELGFNHPVMESILHCLRNQPILRPEIWEVSPSLCKQAASHRNKLGDWSTHRDILHSYEKERKKNFQKFSTQFSTDSAYGSVSDADIEQLRNRVRRLSAQNESLRRISIHPGNLFSKHLHANHLSDESKPLTPENVKLDWERCSDLPVGMFRAQATVIANSVYVGGGITEDEGGDFYVFEYNMIEDLWSLLPPLPVKQFGLGRLVQDLVVFGGQESHNRISDKTFIFDRYNQSWKELAAVLDTPRFSMTVVEYESSIVAIGGLGRARTRDLETLSSIEVLSGDTGKWTLTGDLPGSACVCSPSPTVDSTGNLYLLGGYRAQTAVSATSRVHCSPLSTLTSVFGMSLNTWKLLPPTPHLQTTAVSLNGCILALGGSDKPYSKIIHKTIHAFDRDTQEWTEVDQLPYSSCHCTAVAVSSNEVLVLGGWVRPGKRKASRSVYRGRLATNDEDMDDYITLPAITISS